MNESGPVIALGRRHRLISAGASGAKLAQTVRVKFARPLRFKPIARPLLTPDANYFILILVWMG